MAKKMLLLIMLSFSLAIGSFWVLRAQDPTTPKPETPQTQPKPQPKPQPQTPAQTTPQTPSQTTPQTTATGSQQVDLSGTYAGTFNCDEAGLVGDTTITINGNEFTTADGRTGRIIASKSRGYTAVALQINAADPSAAATSKVISLRGKKSGNKLTLMPVSGSNMKCSFTPGKSVAKTKTMRGTPSATGTEVAAPTAMPAQTPSPSPSASPTPSPEPQPSPNPSPEPVPSPTPGGSPRPRPRPSPTPSPSPGEPTPSPTPSPSPSPGPRIG
jgi:hypothetical protein